VLGGGAALAALAAAVAAGVGASPSASVYKGVDNALCSFPFRVTVTSTTRAGQVGTTALRYAFDGPTTVRLANARTGKTVTLRSDGLYDVDTTTGSIGFRGHEVWLWSTGKHVPYLTTDGSGRLVAPAYVLSPGASRSRVVDPCALLAPTPPSIAPARTPAPWGLPANTLSRIGATGIAPLLGSVIRHDHLHLDVIVDGRRVTVPAGVGLAEPVDRGPCPSAPDASGDCATKQSFFGAVANSPLHTHSPSGIIHIEADRHVSFTLGQFFDEWGVRFDSSCIGAYCTGSGGKLRVFVGGKRVTGDPRRLVLRNRQEIAVVFGRTGDFARVPATYEGGWPGAGCGGPGERSCLP
jgi:hypothetical protein